MKLALTGQEKKFLAIKYQKEGLTRKVDINNKIKEVSKLVHQSVVNHNRNKKENENPQANLIKELYS